LLLTVSVCFGVDGVSKYGYWLENIRHDYDHELALAIGEVLQKKGVTTVADFGCGDGRYIKTLIALGFDGEGFDGNPHTPTMTDGVGKVLNIALPQNLGKKYDFVISLEVGEHIPKKFEATFLANLDRHNIKGIILSWAVPGQGGYGHFNERSNQYIKKQLRKLGYRPNNELQEFLRQSATIFWFKNTVMVFEKIQTQ